MIFCTFLWSTGVKHETHKINNETGQHGFLALVLDFINNRILNKVSYMKILNVSFQLQHTIFHYQRRFLITLLCLALK